MKPVSIHIGREPCALSTSIMPDSRTGKYLLDSDHLEVRDRIFKILYLQHPAQCSIHGQ